MAKERERIEPKEGEQRFVRRDEQGQFAEQEDTGRSLPQDRQREAKSRAKKGERDRGDQSHADKR